ncbi:thioesterase family protein [Actinocorallia longicatena]|uniref:Thioesterase family protein n=1 Tax=Actinocorallia longicatena TaxID=111803 RepID=A0ABP6QL58_9ACTN
MTRFADATGIVPLGEGRYRAELDEGFGFGAALNGGYLMATVMRAVVAESRHEHPVATAVNFLRPAGPGPAEIVVEQRKDGKTASMARATLVQDGKAILDAQVTTGTLDLEAVPVYCGPAPAMAPLEACQTSGRGSAERGFPARVDMRFDPAAMGWLDGRPTGRPEMRAYFRLAEHDDPDPYVLALALDALIPVVSNTGIYGWSPTVELTWHLRALPAPGWLTVHGTGRLVSDGWFDENVEIWDARGTLVAQSHQLARAARGR